MKSNLLKKIAGWVIMVFFGMTILTGCDDYNFDIPLTPFLLLDSYNVNFDQNSGERILEVRCNEEWTIELSKELQGWCSVTRNEDDNLIVSVILSEDKYVRRGEFYVKAFSQTDTVRVAQLGYQQAIWVSPQNMNIDAAGDKVLVEVTSNVDYIITLPDWIIKETQPDTRAPQETVTKQYLFKIESNKGAKRMGEIVFADSDEMSDLEPTVINVVQKGLDVYEPVAPEEGNDIQLFPNSAEGDGGVPGGNYDATFDNDLTTEWQANWKAPIGLVYPQYIEYTFDEPVDLDYIIYHCTYSANRFKDVKIEVLTDVNKTRSAEYVKVYEGTFDNANSTRADFNASQSNVTKVKFTISTCYNMSKPLRCQEMQFFQKDPNAFKYDELFTDIACTDLKPTVTEEDILNCKSSFYKTLAWFMYNNEYQREFRIANYKAYPHPDIDAAVNKTAKYSLLDNPTGIFVPAGENLVVMADLNGLDKVNIRVQNLDKPGQDGFGGTEYTIVNGVNTISIKEKGLVYVMYHKDDYENAPEITLHFASGKVNGYYDSQNPKLKGRWKELLNNSVDTHFDVIGKYVHLTFTTRSFLNYTKDVDNLINLYDDMIYRQQEFLGLEKYDRMFHNRSYFHVHYNSGSFMYATDYHTAYIESSLNYLADETQMAANCWGPAHELGHIHQTRPGLKWHGMTEVTNNITAIYVQTKVYNEPSRLTVQDRYVSAFNSIMAGQKAHNAESDVFNKLVPFWQLELYFGEVKGNTPMKRTDHGGFYADIYEKVRTTANPTTDGLCQLEFVYNSCVSAGMDLTGFFEKWGFLSPIDMMIGDYTNKQFTITETEIANVRNRIVALGLPKCTDAVEYIVDNTVDIFKDKKNVIAGIASYQEETNDEGITTSTITVNNWQNVVAFEVLNADNKLICVFEGSKKSYKMNTAWENGYKLMAVQYDGSRIAASIK